MKPTCNHESDWLVYFLNLFYLLVSQVKAKFSSILNLRVKSSEQTYDESNGIMICDWCCDFHYKRLKLRSLHIPFLYIYFSLYLSQICNKKLYNKLLYNSCKIVHQLKNTPIKFKGPVRIKSIRIRRPEIKNSLRKFDYFIIRWMALKQKPNEAG